MNERKKEYHHQKGEERIEKRDVQRGVYDITATQIKKEQFDSTKWKTGK